MPPTDFVVAGAYVGNAVERKNIWAPLFVAGILICISMLVYRIALTFIG